MMIRLRSLQQAYEEIHKADPDSAISFGYIRKSVIDGRCPATKSGKKWLVDMDALENFIRNETNKNQVT